mgnify:FL=1
MLKKPLGTINERINRGKLKYRYERGTGFKIRRVIDYFQIWDYILNELPTPEDLDSPGANKTAQAIAKIVGWRRLGSERAKRKIKPVPS